MALSTHSVFYYGYVVDETNRYINFKEGAGAEKTAVVPVGTYSLTRFLQVVALALNNASAISWGVTVDRATRLITILPDSTASLLFSTGSSAANSLYALLGFTASDFLNQSVFFATAPSGKEYRPQYRLQDYKDKSQVQKLINATVNKSASKQVVSVQHFGVESWYKFNIKYITNRDIRGSDDFYKYNNQAVEEAKAFLQWVTQKYVVEFMPDENDAATYDRMYLDTSAQDNEGVGYELREYIDQDLPEFYESGLLTFTVIDTEY